MFKKSTVISFLIFFILMFFTPIIKNSTRIIEKNIYKLNKEIGILEKKVIDSKIDFVYLSSPGKLTENLENSGQKEYLSFDYSRIFLSTEDFLRHSSQQTRQTKITN